MVATGNFRKCGSTGRRDSCRPDLGPLVGKRVRVSPEQLGWRPVGRPHCLLRFKLHLLLVASLSSRIPAFLATMPSAASFPTAARAANQFLQASGRDIFEFAAEQRNRLHAPRMQPNSSRILHSYVCNRRILLSLECTDAAVVRPRNPET